MTVPTSITLETALQMIETLKTDIETLSHDAAYGCYTRAGFDRRVKTLDARFTAVVFGDIDAMHEHNATHGYGAINARIAAALATVGMRHSTDLLTARYYSGDELIWIAPAQDAGGLAERITAAFAASHLSITLGVAHVETTLQAAIQAAADAVQTAKQARAEVLR